MSGYNWLPFIGGAVLWTYLENRIHRAAHIIPAFRKPHMDHHRNPQGPSSPTLPYIVGIPLVLYLMSSVIFRPDIAFALVGGILGGFTFYIAVHYAIHHFNIQWSKYLTRRKEYHDTHHKGKKNTYGVTTSFWDKK